MTDISRSPHAAHLLRAVDLARHGLHADDGGPFGAVVVRDGQVVAEGWNRVVSTLDPTAHAEVVAIRAACAALGTFQLAGTVVYCSCEPCPMCLGALYWARPDAVWFAASRHDAERVGFSDAAIYDEIALAPQARSLPFHQLDVPGAREVFDLWNADPDRVAY
ncbi:MAG: nucleoside deaminase [Actinomycetes bacterium]